MHWERDVLQFIEYSAEVFSVVYDDRNNKILATQTFFLKRIKTTTEIEFCHDCVCIKVFDLIQNFKCYVPYAVAQVWMFGLKLFKKKI